MTRQFSPLGFETTYVGAAQTEYKHYHTARPPFPAHNNELISSTTKYMLKISDIDVAVAWSNGVITSNRITYQEHTLLQGYYFANNGAILTPGSFQFKIAPIITPEAGITESNSPHTYFTILSMAVYADTVYVLGTMEGVLHLYTANKHKYSTNISTPEQVGEPVGEITLPTGITVGSPLYAAYGKLWLVSTEQDGSMRNLLHIYDIAMQTWSFVSIPGRHQYIERRISDDYDGNIIITNMNDHGVVVINAFTNTHVKSIKVNRHTYGLARNENKVLYVMSDKQNQALVSSTKSDAELVDSAGANAGLFVMEKPSAESTSVLSQIDIAAGTSTAIGTAMGLDYVMDDLRTGYRWTVGGPVGWRILSTSSAETAEDDTKALAEQLGLLLLYKSAVDTPGDLPSDPANNNPKRYDTYFCTEDSQLYCWKYPGNVRIKIATQAADESIGIDCIQGVMTNQFTYDRYDPETDTVTSSTVRPFLFLRTETGVVAYRLTSLIGVNSSEVLGTAMIAIGPQAYIGD